MKEVQWAVETLKYERDKMGILKIAIYLGFFVSFEVQYQICSMFGNAFCRAEIH